MEDFDFTLPDPNVHKEWHVVYKDGEFTINDVMYEIAPDDPTMEASIKAKLTEHTEPAKELAIKISDAVEGQDVRIVAHALAIFLAATCKKQSAFFARGLLFAQAAHTFIELQKTMKETQ